MSGDDCTSRDRRLIDPPKLSGPMVDAEPGLRSKSVAPNHWPGKNDHEWCEPSLVSSNGMPSKVMLYLGSANPRKKVLPWPRPTPFGLMLNAPGDIWSTSAKSAI